MFVYLGIILFHPYVSAIISGVQKKQDAVFFWLVTKTDIVVWVNNNCECNILWFNCDNLDVVIVWKPPVRK